jgi:hypothetical protein
LPNRASKQNQSRPATEAGDFSGSFDAGAKDPMPPGSRSKFSTEAPESREVAQHFFSRIASQTIFRFGANV